MRNEEAGQSGPRLNGLLVVVVTDTKGQLQLVAELDIGFTKQPVGRDRQIVGIDAIGWRTEVAGRQWCRQPRCRIGVAKRREGSDDAGEVVDPERVNVVAVLSQVELSIDAADQEVERPIPIRRDDRFCRPACLVLVRTVKVLRGIAADPVTAKCAGSGFFGKRGAKNAARAIGRKCGIDRSQIGIRIAGLQGTQSRRVERAILNRKVVILRRIKIDFLIVAADLQLQTATQILFDTALNDPFLREIGRGQVRIDRPHVGRIGGARPVIGIGSRSRRSWSTGRAIKAAKCECGWKIANGKEFPAGQHAHEGRVGIGHLEIALAIQAAQNAGRIALAHLLLDAHPVVFFMEVLRHEVDRRARSGLDPDRAAHTIHVAIIDLRTVKDVLGIAAAVQIEPGNTHGRNIAERHVDHALGFD